MSLRRARTKAVESDHDRMLRCKTYLERHVLDQILEADRRPLATGEDHEAWLERLIGAMTDATASWVARNGGHLVPIETVRDIDRYSSGHVDYASKFALRVAEHAVYGQSRP